VAAPVSAVFRAPLGAARADTALDAGMHMGADEAMLEAKSGIKPAGDASGG